jgi:hypothetical protein
MRGAGTWMVREAGARVAGSARWAAVRVVWLGLVLVATNGCGGTPAGPPGVTVVGVLMRAGKPFVLPGRDVGLGDVEVHLVPVGLVEAPAGTETGLQAESGLADGNGRFEIKGAGRGVPPGRYRVAVFARDRGFQSDALGAAFAPERTPLEIDLPENLVGAVFDVGTVDLSAATLRDER